MNKKVSDSTTEWTRCLQYADINGANRLFGGRLMAWMDEVAAITAQRHCGRLVTTACVDNLQFKSGASLADIIVLIAKVTYVGKTSMEIRVDVYVEDVSNGERRQINHAYFTEVCVDQEGKPQPIEFGLELESENERAEWESALRRRELRKQRRVEGF
ncbi:MAG: acyl-CoA thioesterase [Lachnospiraceae bacterium]|nr:acyl-CoA thioesterase [Lachnospiraceae bacterium]